MLMDILDRTIFQGYFGVDQMSYGHFEQDKISRFLWHGRNVLGTKSYGCFGLEQISTSQKDRSMDGCTHFHNIHK